MKYFEEGKEIKVNIKGVIRLRDLCGDVYEDVALFLDTPEGYPSENFENDVIKMLSGAHEMTHEEILHLMPNRAHRLKQYRKAVKDEKIERLNKEIEELEEEIKSKEEEIYQLTS